MPARMGGRTLNWVPDVQHGCAQQLFGTPSHAMPSQLACQAATQARAKPRQQKHPHRFPGRPPARRAAPGTAQTGRACGPPGSAPAGPNRDGMVAACKEGRRAPALHVSNPGNATLPHLHRRQQDAQDVVLGSGVGQEHLAHACIASGGEGNVNHAMTLRKAKTTGCAVCGCEGRAGTPGPCLHQGGWAGSG